MRRSQLPFPVLAAATAGLLALAPGAVRASDDAAAEARLVFHEDLVLGLDPEAPLGRVDDIAVDPAGNVYVLDSGFMTVHKFAPDGTHLGDIGREGEAPGEFFTPACLAIGPQGYVYVAGGSSVITAIHPDGMPGPVIRQDRAFRARQIRFDPAGRLYIVGFEPISQKVVHRYAAGTYEHLYSFCDSYAVERDLEPVVGATYAGGCLDFTSTGDILFAQYAPQRVYLFSDGGELVKTHDARFSESSSPPRPRVDGNTVTMTFSAMTTGLIVLESGRFLTTLAVPPAGDEKSYTLFDIYDETGRRLAGCRLPGWMTPMCRDGEGRIYMPRVKDMSAEETVPAVVRYRMEIVGPDRAPR